MAPRMFATVAESWQAWSAMGLKNCVLQSSEDFGIGVTEDRLRIPGESHTAVLLQG